MLDVDDEPRLDSFEGARAPAGLVRDLRAYAELSAAARADFWSVLEPNLAEQVDDRVGAFVAKFCREREVTTEALGPVVRSLRHLFRAAAALGLAPPRVAADLVACGLAEELVTRELAPCYERAFGALRQRLVAEAVAEHGNLVTDVSWRVDSIRASHRAKNLSTPVALVTFRYRHAGEQRAITLELLPDMLERLGAEVARILR
jgi:hypothetical protein